MKLKTLIPLINKCLKMSKNIEKPFIENGQNSFSKMNGINYLSPLPKHIGRSTAPRSSHPIR